MTGKSATRRHRANSRVIDRVSGLWVAPRITGVDDDSAPLAGPNVALALPDHRGRGLRGVDGGKDVVVGEGIWKDETAGIVPWGARISAGSWAAHQVVAEDADSWGAVSVAHTVGRIAANG